MVYPWEKQAKMGEPMPDGLKQSEQLAYQALAYLTARYKLKKIDAEQAKAERKKIDQQYAINSANEGYIKWVTDLRTRIEIAHDRYRLDPTAENAELLSKVIDGFVRI